MKARRSISGAVALAIVSVLAIAGCAAGSPTPDTSADGEPQLGGVARIGVTVEMPGFDPILPGLTSTGAGIERAAAVMDTLMYRDEVTDEVFPKLAESLTSDDGETWVLTLREGINFSDGTPLNADAVVFNLERHLAEGSTSTAKGLGLGAVETMEATGDLEVTFHLSEPNGSFPLVFTVASPAGLIGSPAALADPEAFRTNPVGAGPFLVESWSRDNELIMTRNPDYWEDGKPYLDGVTWVVQPEAQTRADSLVSGGVDATQIAEEVVPIVAAADGATLYPTGIGALALIPNSSTMPGSDPGFREAVSKAFDPLVTSQLLYGTTEYWDGDTSCIPFAAGSPVCDPVRGNPYDPDAASELIEEFVAGGGDPVVELTYLQTLTKQAVYMQQQLEAIGLTIELKPVDVAGLIDNSAKGDYQLLTNSMSTTGFPVLWARLDSTSARNWPKEPNPPLDALLDVAVGSSDLDERNDAWRDAMNLVHDEARVTWLAPYLPIMAVADDFHVDLPDHPYTGSTMIYVDSAWLAR